MIYADQRWVGNHGIGRFAREVLATLSFQPVPLTSHPAAAPDPLRLAWALKKLTSRDLFYSPGYSAPLFCAAPYIFTIHDLNHIDRPENSSVSKRVYYATVLKRACHRAVRVLTVSDFTRSRIIEWAGVSPEKVLTIPCGVGPEFSPDVHLSSFPAPYMLCVSNRKGHKNEFRTVQAFAAAGLPAEMKLLFTGEPTAELSSHIESLGLISRVYFAGHIPESDLPSLYKSAVALVFVSLYEGFGLPVVESMACGTPVLTSNTSSLPEAAGGAALLVDPMSVEQIAEGIRRLASDDTLRETLRERGLNRTRCLTWARTAEQVHQVITQFTPS